jgi:hypothetical protein
MMNQPSEASPLRNLWDQGLSALSDQIAGGRRSDPSDLLPGATDPFEGTVPERFLPDVSNFDWFDPTVWAGTSLDSSLDLTAVPASGPGTPGDGSDFFRGSEAPNNYTNRQNPLYQARREFSVAVAPQLERMFGVTAEGSAGYLRPPSAGDADPGGRSANSDHYSGGAADFFGTPAELDALHDYLVEQPYVSFIRWRSESHGGPNGDDPSAHLHVSFDLGWVAQNYYQTRTLPPQAKPPKPAGEPPGSVERPAGTIPQRMGGGPL